MLPAASSGLMHYKGISPSPATRKPRRTNNVVYSNIITFEIVSIQISADGGFTMDNKHIITRGLSMTQLVLGILFVLAGITFILLAYFGNYTLRFHKIILPQWVLYLVAVFAVAFGSFGIRGSFRVWKCGNCGSLLQYGEALYPLEHEGQIMNIYETNTPGQLPAPPSFGNRNEWLKVSLDYCSACCQAGVISITKENARREKKIIGKPKIVPPETIPSYLTHLQPTVRLDRLDIDEQ